MVKVCMNGYKPTELVWEGVILKQAGKLKKAMPLTTKMVNNQIFVHIKTREAWLANAIFGASNRNDMNWSLLVELRQHVEEMEKNIRSGNPPIEKKEALEDEPDDPMHAMGDCGAEDVNAVLRREKKRKEQFTPQVVQVQMPEWPPEAVLGPSTIMRAVGLFLEGNNKLWIHHKDLDWMVRSIWIKFQLKGVGNVAGTDKGPGDDQTLDPCVTPEKRPRPVETDGM